jgi:hypothetical protein
MNTLLTALLLGPLAALHAQQPTTPQRPADFKPFQFEFPSEQLMQKYSADQMKRAEAELRQIQAVKEYEHEQNHIPRPRRPAAGTAGRRAERTPSAEVEDSGADRTRRLTRGCFCAAFNWPRQTSAGRKKSVCGSRCRRDPAR